MAAYLQAFVAAYLQAFVAACLEALVAAYLQALVAAYLQALVAAYLQALVAAYLQAFVAAYIKALVAAYIQALVAALSKLGIWFGCCFKPVYAWLLDINQASQSGCQAFEADLASQPGCFLTQALLADPIKPMRLALTADVDACLRKRLLSTKHAAACKLFHVFCFMFKPQWLYTHGVSCETDYTPSKFRKTCLFFFVYIW